jgi:hypothetical protein
MDDIFLQCSRCNEHGSNMSNKRLRNGSLLLLSKKKGGSVTGLPLPSGERQCFATSQRQRSHFC